MSEAASASAVSAPATGESAPDSASSQPQGALAPQTQAAKPAVEDPEWELEGFGKKKRSEWAKEFERSKGLERAAHERNRESAQIRKEAQALLQALKTNPRQTLRQLGVDVTGMSQEELTEQLAEATLTQEQRQQRDLQRERDEYKQRVEEFQEQQKQQVQQAEIARHAAAYEQQFIEAIKQVGLVVDPITVVRMGELANFYLKEGIEASAVELAQELRRRDLMAQRTYLRPDISDDQIDEFVPVEVQERIRQKFLKQAQAITPRPQPNNAPRKPMQPAKNANGYIDYDEWARFKKGMHR